MRNYFKQVRYGALFTVAGLLGTAGAAAASPLIRPGIGIGQVLIGETEPRVLKDLGAPGGGDSAMMHHWAFWYSKRTGAKGYFRPELDVYSTADNNPKMTIRVRQIRATSPAFHTQRGLHVGSRISAIRRRCPGLRPIGEFPSGVLQGKVTLLDDRKRGVLFEVLTGAGQPSREGRCVAIVVHQRGKSPDKIYLQRETYPGPEESYRRQP